MTPTLHARTLPVLLGPVLALGIWSPPAAHAATAAGCIISGVGYDFSIVADGPDAEKFCDGLVKDPPSGMRMEHAENITAGDTEICQAKPTDVNQIQIWDDAEHVYGDRLCKEFSEHMEVTYAQEGTSVPTGTASAHPDPWAQGPPDDHCEPGWKSDICPNYPPKNTDDSCIWEPTDTSGEYPHKWVHPPRTPECS